jgi:hypothetical protein
MGSGWIMLHLQERKVFREMRGKSGAALVLNSGSSRYRSTDSKNRQSSFCSISSEDYGDLTPPILGSDGEHHCSAAYRM